jgi:hypothetical protein
MSDTPRLRPGRPVAAPGPVHPGFTPDDPLYAVIAAVGAMQQQAHRELGGMVSKLAEDVAASAVLAENAARAKAEMIVTQAGEWAGETIRAAGQEVVTALLAERAVREINHDIRQSRLIWLVLGAAVIGGGWVGGLTLLLARYVF